MNINEYFPSKYLKAADIDGDTTCIIDRVEPSDDPSSLYAGIR